MDPVDLPVLSLYLVAHVDSHVAQVANHVGDFTHVLFHLVFSSVVCYPEHKQSFCRFARSRGAQRSRDAVRQGLRAEVPKLKVRQPKFGRFCIIGYTKSY